MSFFAPCLVSMVFALYHAFQSVEKHEVFRSLKITRKITIGHLILFFFFGSLSLSENAKLVKATASVFSKEIFHRTFRVSHSRISFTLTHAHFLPPLGPNSRAEGHTSSWKKKKKRAFFPNIIPTQTRTGCAEENHLRS